MIALLDICSAGKLVFSMYADVFELFLKRYSFSFTSISEVLYQNAREYWFASMLPT
jgi:hypothetical protein